MGFACRQAQDKATDLAAQAQVRAQELVRDVSPSCFKLLHVYIRECSASPFHVNHLHRSFHFTHTTVLVFRAVSVLLVLTAPSKRGACCSYCGRLVMLDLFQVHALQGPLHSPVMEHLGHFPEPRPAF